MCEEDDDIIEIDEDNLEDLPYDALIECRLILPFLPVCFRWLKDCSRLDGKEYIAYRHVSALRYDALFKNNLKRIAEKGCHTKIALFCNKRSYNQKTISRLRRILSAINPHNTEIVLLAYNWVVPKYMLEEFASKLSGLLGTEVKALSLEERIITSFIDYVWDGRPAWLRKLTRINR